MNDTAAPKAIRVTSVLTLAALLGVWGCKSSPRSKPAETPTEAKQEAPKDSVPSLDNSASCLVDMMRNPTGPFHFSMLRKDSDLPAPFTSEADFTPDTLEGSTSSSSGKEVHKISSVHSDPHGWGGCHHGPRRTASQCQRRHETRSIYGHGCRSGTRRWL